MITVKTTFVIYDIDGNDEIPIELPQELTFEFDDEDDVENNLPDRISDETGWCVLACDYKIIS